MNHTLLTTTLAATMVLLPGTAAPADTSQQRWLQVFEQLDQDRDGALSRAEYERANSLQISATPGQNPYLPASGPAGTASYPGQIPYLVLVPNPYGSPAMAPPSGSGATSQVAWVPIQSIAAPQQSSLVAFEGLDTDRNGYLNAFEALRSYPLIQSWNKVDVNRDGQIERAEFSAFELGAMR